MFNLARSDPTRLAGLKTDLKFLEEARPVRPNFLKSSVRFIFRKHELFKIRVKSRRQLFAHVYYEVGYIKIQYKRVSITS